MKTVTENNLTIADDFCEFSRTYSYDPSGLTTAKTLGNGIAYSATFDSANRMTSCNYKKGASTRSTPVAGYNYAYDDAGNKKYEEKVHDPENSQLVRAGSHSRY